MKISVKDISKLISESIQKVLSEGISNITYHFTSLNSCIKILKNNEFFLTLSTNKSDAYDNKRLFYLSTQRGRNKELGFAGHMSSCVRIQLDGNALMQNLKGRPVDYWGETGKRSYYDPKYDYAYGPTFTRTKQTHHNFEMEDRIFSYEPVIKNADKYILRIDVYIDPQESYLSSENPRVRENHLAEVNRDKDLAVTINWLCRHFNHRNNKDNAMPVYFYDNLKDFNFMTNNTINDEILKLQQDDFHAKTQMDWRDYDRAKINNELDNKGKYVEILKHLMVVYFDGKGLRNGQETYKKVADLLRKYGLEKYIEGTVSRLNKAWGNDFLESCNLLTNTINAPLRKLNTEFPGDDANKIMKLGAYVLRSKGANNFNDLLTKKYKQKFVAEAKK